MFARSVFSSTCGGIRKSTRRPSNDRRTSPETPLSPTCDLRSCAPTTGSRRVERRAKHPSSVTSQHRKKMSAKVGQEASLRCNRTTRHHTSVRQTTTFRPASTEREVRVHRSRCACFGRTTTLGTSVVNVITGQFISNGLRPCSNTRTSSSVNNRITWTLIMSSLFRR